MCGCIVVKPAADRIVIYPSLFHHDVTAISVATDYSDLASAVLPILRNLTRAEAIADTAMSRFRQYAEPAQVAADFSSLLGKIVVRQRRDRQSSSDRYEPIAGL